MGGAIKTAEGTTLVLNQVQWNGTASAGNKFLWTLVSGPADKIRIDKVSDLRPRVTIGNLEAPAEWLLHLQASDGRNNAGGDLRISAFPARLQAKQRVGGAWVGVKRMGDKWVTARGNEVEIFNPDFSPLTKFDTGRTITQFFAGIDDQGKGGVYVQAPEGNWALFRSDPVQGVKKIEFPQLGRSVRRLFPFQAEGVRYVFALLERNIELWSLADPDHPRLKTSLGNFLKNPLYLAVAQKTIYVAEEDQIHLIEYSTGNLIASLPSGGSVNGLATYSIDGKEFLLVAIGKDRTNQGRKDYGVRLFEVLPGGRLGAEQRLSLGDQSPISRALVIPEAGKALLVAGEEGSLSLRMLDLRQRKEVTLQGEAAQGLMAGTELSTGRIGEQSVAAIADGNQLRILAFKPAGEGTYSVTLLKNFPTILSSAWIKSRPDGNQIWVGDEGTRNGGALVEIEDPEFKVGRAWNAPPGSFPAHADFRTGGPLSPILYLAEDLSSTQTALAEGMLGLVEEGKKAGGPEISKPVHGNRSPQGVIRGAGIGGRSSETGLRIVAALSRISGNAGNAGLAILDKEATLTPKAFLAQDLGQKLTVIPLPDARDVVLSPDGKAAFVAAGTHGVVAVDLEKKVAVARVSLGSEDWIADRLVLGQGGDFLLALFVNRGNRQVLLKTFGVTPNYQMQEYGNLPGLPSVNTVEGVRAPRPALTDDDLYLFIPTQARTLGVFNLSNPAAPAKIAELEVEGEIRGISLANRFKDVFLALGAAGAAKLEFGF